jgi:hypothetical protein
MLTIQPQTHKSIEVQNRVTGIKPRLTSVIQSPVGQGYCPNIMVLSLMAAHWSQGMYMDITKRSWPSGQLLAGGLSNQWVSILPHM